MFSNQGLDVFIGLVFIFLLYSLLASVISELIAMLFAYRHRMLEKAIEQMLDGKNVSYYWWDKLGNIFLWVFRKKKPARSTFFSTERLNKTVLKSATAEEPYIPRIKLNQKAALFAAQVRNHPLYRNKSEQSLLFKKPAYITASCFADILVDLLSNPANKANGKPVLLEEIRQFVNNNNAGLRDDLKNTLNISIEKANGDLQRFRLMLETWFDETMDRASGWYKRQTFKILLSLGFTLGMVFNVNVFHIVKKLSTDKVAREAMVQHASDFVKERYSNSPTIDSPAVIKDTSIGAIKKKVEEIKLLYASSIDSTNTLMGLGWGDYGDPARYTNGVSTLCWWDKVKFVAGKTFLNLKNLIGFFILGLAVSMGAPFWFDLLNKLVNLRAGGKKPSSSKNNAGSSDLTAPTNRKPLPDSFG